MYIPDHFKASVLQLGSDSNEFEPLALEIFESQARHNITYRHYLDFLGIRPSTVGRVEKIPFLPIQFFKGHRIISGEFESSPHIFESSGTSQAKSPSRHYVADLPFYEALSHRIFELSYGNITDYHILALLPSYLERSNSSLVYMIQSFMYRACSQDSGFYLRNFTKLIKHIKKLLENDDRKILLIGVTFALLDLAEQPFDWSFLEPYRDRFVLMETGGMKGRREELLREEVHQILCNRLGVEKVHSEYGMTELLSQSYSKGGGLFSPPPTMRILLREVNDPFSFLPQFSIGNEQQKPFRTGGINVIDLGNIDSCCFIETQDLGMYSSNYQHFIINGRFDNSDLRGCNLMAI